jgi:hypothetical protein
LADYFDTSDDFESFADRLLKDLDDIDVPTMDKTASSEGA